LIGIIRLLPGHHRILARFGVDNRQMQAMFPEV